jgi:isopenicillin N synthase-like dioxygenase
MARDGNTLLRIIHYPPVPEDAPAAAVRAAAHEDINLITLLCEATAGGLELLTREGTWLPIQAQPGQIIVDSGDMIQNLTNGLLRSTTHRVTNPGNNRERRFSMPFFVHPRSEVDLSPLPGCLAHTGGQPQYPSLSAGEYLLQRLREIGLA